MPEPPVDLDRARIDRVLDLDREKDAFYPVADKEMDKLFAAGILDKDSAVEDGYTDYYAPKREVRILGGKLVYFEYERMVEWVGCCVDEGFGMVLEGSPSESMKAFADQHECRIRKDVYLPFDAAAIVRKSRGNQDGLVEISCRYSDAEEFAPVDQNTSPDEAPATAGSAAQRSAQ